MAGYSGTPLVRKLGIKPGHRMAVVNEPADYWDLLEEVPDEVEVVSDDEDGLDFVHVFARSRAELSDGVAAARSRIKDDGMIWASWPKKASGVETDLSGGVVRDIAAEHRLVDVKVCAVDETWSGQKLVIRVRDRG